MKKLFAYFIMSLLGLVVVVPNTDFSAFFMDPLTGKIGLKAFQSVGCFKPTLTLENLTQLNFTKVA